MLTLSIIIPVYNEERYIVAVLEKIRQTSLPAQVEKQVIVVNDCSSDATEQKILAYQKEEGAIALIM